MSDPKPIAYPRNEVHSILGAAPFIADPKDLALGIMVAKSFIEADIVLMNSEDPEMIEKTKDVFRREIGVAMVIAEERGLFADGTMELIFEQISEVWAEPEPNKKVEDDLDI